MTDWTTTIEQYEDVIVDYDTSTNTYRLYWEFMDEGYCGDFDPTDEEDSPLLRFTIVIVEDDGNEIPLEDASYCTLNDVSTSREDLVKFGTRILALLATKYDNDYGYKHELEEISWVKANGDKHVGA